MTSIMFGKKGYTWRDKEYYKLSKRTTQNKPLKILVEYIK